MSLFCQVKNTKKPVLRQILDLIPSHILSKAINKYESDKYCSRYKTRDALVAYLFGQLSKCSTLEDISVGLGISQSFIRDVGLSQSPARSTMSDGNKKRTWQVFEYLFYELLSYYESSFRKYGNQSVIEEVKDKTIVIRDSTTISLCLSLFDWASFRTSKGGIKIHTQWDEAMMLPNLICISEASLHDSKGFHQSVFPEGTIILEDKGYWDFDVLLQRIQAKNVFVTRIKDNSLYESVEELDLPEGSDHHILKDEIITLKGSKAIKNGLSEKLLRRVVVYDVEKDMQLQIITNNHTWQASTIAALYKKRWDIEIFFKQLKQNLHVKTFIGTSENAVKSQIYVAMIAYLLLELLRRVAAKKITAFSNFVEKIRICLGYYLTLEYLISRVKPVARSIRLKQGSLEFDSQETLFS